MFLLSLWSIVYGVPKKSSASKGIAYYREVKIDLREYIYSFLNQVC